ncbi:MAG: response regulator, partial [Planctomycetes bacterium]|nr:response regulator [Planctomycetota bacterium]
VALREADYRKNEFLAVLGHELRNSLAPILNAVEVLRLAGSNEGAIQQVRDLIERQARQMARLVDDLLDLTRITLGKVELRKECLDLATAIAQAVEASGPLIQVLNHRLSIHLPTEPLWLEADRTRLVQMITNLLNNAAKYTDPGGQIWLTGERIGQEAVIRVRDTGIGIPPEMLSRIFDIFTQVDRTSGRTQGGVGIGLTLVKKLVEMHGGSVEAHSGGPGQGSEFVVRLPALPVHSSSPPSGTAVLPKAASTRHVLIIEDNPDGRETMQALLKLWGHRVEAAEDGQGGVAMALASNPQVALIDLGLPRWDGYEVAKKLRASLGQNIYLVAMTGFGQAEDRRRTLEAGFDAHLVKPVDMDELARLLTDLPQATPEQET